MKYLLSVIFALTMCVSLMTVKASAATKFTYTVNEDNSVTITGYSETDDDELVIPEKIDGHIVSDIASKAFYGERYFEKVTIPKTVKHIGGYAFSYMDNCSEFVVDSENSAYCSKNEVLYTKDMTRLVNYPLKKKGSVFVIPSSVEYFECTSFGNCKQLKAIITYNTKAHGAGYTFFGTSMDIYGVKGTRIEEYTRKIGSKSEYGSDIHFKPLLTSPKNLKCSKNEDNRTLSWQAVTGAEGYKIYGYNTENQKYELIGTTSKTSYTLKNTADYSRVKVRAYVKYGKMSYNGEESTIRV